MKKVVILAALLLLSAGTAAGQTVGQVRIYSSTVVRYCDDVTVPQTGLLSLYIVHSGHSGALGVRFSAPKPECAQMLFLNDTQFFTTLGNSQTGVAVAYGACLTAEVHVLTMNFFVQGGTSACCTYPIVEFPGDPQGTVTVADCAGNEASALTYPRILNPNDACCECCLPVEESTWGCVKSLFHD